MAPRISRWSNSHRCAPCPSIRVYRPADAVEALECWYDAMTAKGPSVMVVARQKVAPARTIRRADMPSRRGAYVLSEAEGPRHLTLLATGSEVEIALAARSLLAEHGVQAAVVSMPCLEVFDIQPQEYRTEILAQPPVTRSRQARLMAGAGTWAQQDERLGLIASGPRRLARCFTPSLASRRRPSSRQLWRT